MCNCCHDVRRGPQCADKMSHTCANCMHAIYPWDWLQKCIMDPAMCFLVLTSSLFVLPALDAGIPLKLENIINSIKDVTWESLCWCLRVPDSKRSEIEAQHLPANHRRVLVKWWLHSYPKPSWRRLIQRFDKAYKKCNDSSCGHAADNIRHNAEPVQGIHTFMCKCNMSVVNYLNFHFWAAKDGMIQHIILVATVQMYSASC